VRGCVAKQRARLGLVRLRQARQRAAQTEAESHARVRGQTFSWPELSRSILPGESRVFAAARGDARACVPCATVREISHAGRCVAETIEARQKKVGMFLLVAAAHAASEQHAAGREQSDKTGGGAAKSARRLFDESRGGGGGSGCELTPSHLLAEVYHRDGTVRGACYSRELRVLLPAPFDVSSSSPARLLRQHATHICRQRQASLSHKTALRP
jgi:hypothetical protein